MNGNSMISSSKLYSLFVLGLDLKVDRGFEVLGGAHFFIPCGFFFNHNHINGIKFLCGTGWNLMLISFPSLFMTMWCDCGSVSASEISATNRGHLIQMFLSVVLIRITDTLLAFGV